MESPETESLNKRERLGILIGSEDMKTITPSFDFVRTYWYSKVPFFFVGSVDEIEHKLFP